MYLSSTMISNENNTGIIYLNKANLTKNQREFYLQLHFTLLTIVFKDTYQILLYLDFSIKLHGMYRNADFAC
jgi:hypothetical protein